MTNNKIIDSNAKNLILLIDKEKCINCKLCDLSCPLVKCHGFKTINDAPFENCFLCGHCVAICKNDAIIHPMLQKAEEITNNLPTSEQIYNYIKLRRSTREFLDKKIEKADWEKIIEVFKYAPTSRNFENIDLIIIESKDKIRALSDAIMFMRKKLNSHFNNKILDLKYKLLLGKTTFKIIKKDLDLFKIQKDAKEQGHDPYLFNAPAIILFIGPSKEMMSKTDADLAAQTITLMAPSLGLGTCYSCLLTTAFQGTYPPIKKIINIPKKYKVFNALMIGYEKYKFSKIPPRKDRNIFYY